MDTKQILKDANSELYAQIVISLVTILIGVLATSVLNISFWDNHDYNLSKLIYSGSIILFSIIFYYSFKKWKEYNANLKTEKGKTIFADGRKMSGLLACKRICLGVMLLILTSFFFATKNFVKIYKSTSFLELMYSDLSVKNELIELNSNIKPFYIYIEKFDQQGSYAEKISFENRIYTQLRNLKNKYSLPLLIYTNSDNDHDDYVKIAKSGSGLIVINGLHDDNLIDLSIKDYGLYEFSISQLLSTIGSNNKNTIALGNSNPIRDVFSHTDYVDNFKEFSYSVNIDFPTQTNYFVYNLLGRIQLIIGSQLLKIENFESSINYLRSAIKFLDSADSQIRVRTYNFGFGISIYPELDLDKHVLEIAIAKSLLMVSYMKNVKNISKNIEPAPDIILNELSTHFERYKAISHLTDNPDRTRLFKCVVALAMFLTEETHAKFKRLHEVNNAIDYSSANTKNDTTQALLRGFEKLGQVYREMQADTIINTRMRLDEYGKMIETINEEKLDKVDLKIYGGVRNAFRKLRANNLPNN